MRAEISKERGGQRDATQYHEATKGDTPSKPTARRDGDASRDRKSFEANQEILEHPNLIKVGQKLRIP